MAAVAGSGGFPDTTDCASATAMASPEKALFAPAIHCAGAGILRTAGDRDRYLSVPLIGDAVAVSST